MIRSSLTRRKRKGVERRPSETARRKLRRQVSGEDAESCPVHLGRGRKRAMKRLQTVYVFCLYGALGGLAASVLHQYFLLDKLASPLPVKDRFIYLALLGGVVGMAIGFFPSFSEGRANYSLEGATRVGIIGALLGGVGGLVALPLAEAMHQWLGGGLLGRMTALSFLGLCIGIAEGVIGGARPLRGIVGGFVGGIVAGFILEKLLPYSGLRADSGILALMSIGFSISLFIALFVNVLADAWLEGQPGSKVGDHVFHLGKFRRGEKALLGADKNGAIFIWIPDAQGIHAEITIQANGTVLRHIADSDETRVNGVPVHERLLHNGDMIEIAGSQLLYRERKELASSSALDAVAKVGQ